MNLLIAYCRAGFEHECASDLAKIAGAGAHIVASPGAGMVTAAIRSLDAERLGAALLRHPPIFARSIFAGDGPYELSSRDRIGPILQAARAHEPPFQALWLESPDSESGKMRWSMCRRLQPLLDAAAIREGLLTPGDARRPRLHVLFVDSARALIGTSEARGEFARWPMGIPRLAMPSRAPSRSTMKLAEAFLTLLSADEQRKALKAGMRAVDLGAAPGGWTWQLVSRGMLVTAVDNADLAPELADSPSVEHLRVDGFRYRPRRRADWMVCDMVEKPSRVALLAARWIADGACQRTIFNLKLPMKKRYEEIGRCSELMRAAFAAANVRARLRLKQLYHDREEVTGYCERLG